MFRIRYKQNSCHPLPFGCPVVFRVFRAEPHSRAPFPRGNSSVSRHGPRVQRNNAGHAAVPRPQQLPIDLEVKAAIEKLSPGTLQRLTHFAKRGVSQLARAGEPVAPDEHEQIVHDAITDTLSRVVVWDRRIKIEVHLFNVVRRRIWNSLRRAHTRAHVPHDALDAENDAAMVSRDGEPEASLGRAQVTQRLYLVVRERAAGDPTVLSILDAYHAEESDRRAVMARTGLLVPEYVNARRRLDRLLAGLPDELRSAALAAMRQPNIP